MVGYIGERARKKRRNLILFFLFMLSILFFYYFFYQNSLESESETIIDNQEIELNSNETEKKIQLKEERISNLLKKINTINIEKIKLEDKIKILEIEIVNNNEITKKTENEILKINKELKKTIKELRAEKINISKQQDSIVNDYAILKEELLKIQEEKKQIDQKNKLLIEEIKKLKTININQEKMIKKLSDTTHH